ncbi:MAG: hypothetical protein OEV37_00475 [Candidatus Berkelbacteria bacterium]|nr:hypothetical protein [Candidatus Berkelbacteria bacterium]
MAKRLDPNLEFYRELDSSHRKKSFCSCTTLGIFFLVVLIILELSLFLLARGFRSSPNLDQPALAPDLPQQLSTVELEDGYFRLVISEGSLCSSLAQVKGFRNLSCQISDEGLVVAGKFGFVFPSNSRLVLNPRIDKGRLAFDLASFSIGKISLPSGWALGLSMAVEEAIYKNAPDLDKAEVEEIEVTDGIVAVKMKKAV